MTTNLNTIQAFFVGSVLLFCNSCSEAPGGGSIGGSGIIDGGLTHAYVIGNIDSITDLVIDGELFDTGQTTFIVNGEAAALSDLRVGMMVNAEVDYTNQDANTVVYQSTVAGPINSVSESGDTIDVLGQQIILSDKTLLDELTTEDLYVGAVIEVHGDRTADNEIVADYIRHRNITDNYFIVGKIDNTPSATNATMEISGTTVDLQAYLVSNPQLLSNLLVGATVNAQISIQNFLPESSPEVAGLEIISNVPIKNYKRLKISGVVDSVLDNQSILVRDITFLTNEETVYLDKHGTAIDPAEIVQNSVIRIIGWTQDDGTVIANKVTLHHTSKSKRISDQQ